MGTEFMEWIGNNYNAEASNLLRFYNSPDTVNDAILKVYDKLKGKPAKAGFKFRGYLFITFRNCVYMASKKKRSTPPPGPTNTTEQETEAANDRHRERLGVEIFDFVKKNYTPIEAGLFRFYYESGKTFIQCAEITGFSKSYIHLKVNKVRAGVRTEFRDKLNVK
jgi:DNA-directed RNA polymerase specialized sigma24 family protein